MTDYAHLWLFFLVVLGVALLPGLEMVFVIGNALAGGRKNGMMAVAGIVAAGICHVTMAALGISVLIRLFPGAFNGLLLAGALYIAWIGILTLRGKAGLAVLVTADTVPSWTAFRRGLVTSLLNPKAYLFTLAIFPQFLHPTYGALWLQAVTMWIIIAVTQIGVYGSAGLVAGQARNWLATHTAAMLWANRVIGSALIMAALFAGIEGWHSAALKL